MVYLIHHFEIMIKLSIVYFLFFDIIMMTDILTGVV